MYLGAAHGSYLRIQVEIRMKKETVLMCLVVNIAHVLFSQFYLSTIAVLCGKSNRV